MFATSESSIQALLSWSKILSLLPFLTLCHIGALCLIQKYCNLHCTVVSSLFLCLHLMCGIYATESSLCLPQSLPTLFQKGTGFHVIKTVIIEHLFGQYNKSWMFQNTGQRVYHRWYMASMALPPTQMGDEYKWIGQKRLLSQSWLSCSQWKFLAWFISVLVLRFVVLLLCSFIFAWVLDIWVWQRLNCVHGDDQMRN